MDGRKKEKKGFAKRATMVKNMVSMFKPRETEALAPAGKHFGEMDMVPAEEFGTSTSKEAEPVFVDPEQTKRLLRGQLTDLTKKLSNALTNIDTMYEDRKGGNILLLDVSMKINQLKSGDMKDQLTKLLVNYNEVNEENQEAVKEREQVFATLADWFTTDSDVKVSFEDYEDTDLKQNYAETLAEFEKLKAIQAQIAALTALGEDTHLLEIQRRNLEKKVIELMRTTQASLPSEKPDAKPEMGVWKTAATEIIELLKTVQTDHPDILIGLNKRLDYLTELLEQQDRDIIGLHDDVAEKKRTQHFGNNTKIIANFVDENNKLNTNVQTLQDRINRYSKELDLAQTILQQCFAVKEDPDGLKAKVTISDMIDQLGGDPSKYDDLDDPSSSSDPFLLHGVIEDQEEMIEILEDKVASLLETVETLEKVTEKQKDKIEVFKEEKGELEETLEEKTKEAEEYLLKLEDLSLKFEQQRECITSLTEEIESLENPTEKMSKSTMVLAEDFSAEISTEITTSFSHVCQQCNCHLSASQADLTRARWSVAEEMEAEFEEDVTSGFNPTHTSPNLDESDRIEFQVYRDQTQGDAHSQPQVMQMVRKEKRIESVPKKDIQPKMNAAVLPPIEQPTFNLEELSSGKTDLVAVADVQCKLDGLIQRVMDYVSTAGRVLAMGDDGHICTHPQKISRLTPYNEKHHMAAKIAKERSNFEYLKRKKVRRMMMVTAQRSIILLKEIYDSMSKELDLQHNDYEIIYRALKTIQHSQPRLMTGSDQQNLKSRADRSGRYHVSQNHRPPQTAPSSSNLYGSASQTRAIYTEIQHPLAGFGHERPDIFNLDDTRSWRHMENYGKREMVKTHTATIPKRGQIKVTAMDFEMKNPDFYDKNKGENDGGEKKARKHRPKSGKSYLINRPDILEQIKLGEKLLQDERELQRQEEGEDLTSYTVRDLTAMLNFPDSRLGRRESPFTTEVRGQMPPTFPANMASQSVTPGFQRQTPGIYQRYFPPATADPHGHYPHGTTDAPAAYIVTPTAYNITQSGYPQTPGTYSHMLAPHGQTPNNQSRVLAGHSHSLGNRTSATPGTGPVAQVYKPNTPGQNAPAYILTPSAYTLTPATMSPPEGSPSHSPPQPARTLPPSSTTTTTGKSKVKKKNNKAHDKHVVLPNISHKKKARR